MIRLLLIWAMASIVVTMLWAALCGPADLWDDQLDDHDDWSRR